MDKIGPYQILETVHRGPQPLYRAKGPDGREVAIKAVAAAGLSPEARERFLREAETCRKLDHPNLVRVFDAGEADGMLYQAMELLLGADLGKVMAEGRQFTWEGKLSIMEQVCDGLQHAHEMHLVHRDIKPANLFLENSGQIRVLDFGMVRVAESELTRVGSSLGTLNYMSPEQIRGERCTAASDVFSVGIVFYQLATGRHPFSRRDRSLPQVVSAIVFEEPPKLSDLAPDAPEGLEFILHKALEKDPAKRLRNAGDLKQALSLCRVTMNLGIGPAPAPVASSAKPAGGGGMAVAQDGEKTRVMQRPGAPPPPVDDEKTRVMQRAAPSMPAAVPPPPAAPRPPVPIKSKPAPLSNQRALQLRYCPACTVENPMSVSFCRNCGTPLAVPENAPAESRMQWGLYAAMAVALLLALALVVVLLTK